MKKFWMISMLLIAALFVVSCGGEDEGGDGGNGGNNSACTEQGAFRCNGDFSQKCDQEEWKNFEQCSTEKPCNATTGKCEAKAEGDTGDTGTDTTDTGSDTTDTGADTTDTGDTGDTTTSAGCEDIFMCMNNCGESDQACAQACFDAGSATGQEDYYAWQQCFSAACQNDPSVQCSVENCPTESAKCGLSYEEGNAAYPAPYGHLDINVNSTYILTNETSLDQSMVNMTYFATGTFGTNGNVQPMGAQGAYYYAALQDDVVQIFQTPFANNGQTALNPAVVLVINANAAPGNISVGLTQDDAAQLFVVDLNGNSVGCYHAFAVGTLTVNTMNVAAGSAGNIAIVGSQIEIYSTENAPMYGGNITSQMGAGFSACPAQ